MVQKDKISEKIEKLSQLVMKSRQNSNYIVDILKYKINEFIFW